MKQFINEIKTGKRTINPIFKKIEDDIIVILMGAMLCISILEVIGIDLIGLYW